MSEAYNLLTTRDEIFQTMVRYGHGLDLKDASLLGSVFADSFEFDFSNLHGRPAGKTTPTQFVKSAFHFMREMKTLHQITNPRIEVYGDRATGMFDIVGWHYAPRQDGDSEYIVRGFYDEQFQQLGAEWKIVRHTIRVAYSTGNPNLFDWNSSPNQ